MTRQDLPSRATNAGDASVAKAALGASPEPVERHVEGQVIKLDRGFPLVQLATGESVRCEHATALAKGARTRATVGDRVTVRIPAGHDKGLIADIAPRSTAFVRRDPAERTTSQVLAANFDLVIIAEPLTQVSIPRLERGLVLAHQTNAHVAVVLTKADLVGSEEDVQNIRRAVQDLAGEQVPVFTLSTNDPASVEQVRHLVAPGTLAILIGESGVGKSSLVNLLAGEEIMQTQAVRDRDGKGRHTTVSRTILAVPDGGSIVDMPGIRGLGLWEADAGLDAAFKDIVELSQRCRFRDCKHTDEPGCAVRAAVESGALAQARLDSYQRLAAEAAQMHEKQSEAAHMRGEKASDRKARQTGSKSSRASRHGGRRGTGRAHA